MTDIERLLGQGRLVTLTGPGGVGKTRLALQVAAEVVEEFPDGVWLVELATVTDHARLPQTVASTVGIREQPPRPLLETLVDSLRSRNMLLVLDNCEHLIGACAHLAKALLESCQHLSILATSREPLDIAGEIVRSLPSLSLPDLQHMPSLDRLMHYEAVRLFVDRA
jgi:predicted ATPase